MLAILCVFALQTSNYSCIGVVCCFFPLITPPRCQDRSISLRDPLRHHFVHCVSPFYHDEVLVLCFSCTVHACAPLSLAIGFIPTLGVCNSSPFLYRSLLRLHGRVPIDQACSCMHATCVSMHVLYWWLLELIHYLFS